MTDLPDAALTLAYGRINKIDEEVDQINQVDALTLACGRINEVEEELDRVNEVEEEVDRVIEEEEPGEEADSVKTTTKLFDEAYIQDPIPNNVLGQLYRGQICSQ